MPQVFPRGARFADPITFGAVPEGFYRVTIPFFQEGRRTNETKLCYESNTGFQIIAVEKVTGQRYLNEKWSGDADALVGTSIFCNNDFIIGLLDQPGPVDAGGQLADPDDWLKNGGGRGGPRFNNMIEASRIDATDDADENCAAMEGREVIMQVNVDREPEGSEYADKNRIVKFFPLPEEEKPKPAARPTTPAARPAPAAARPAAVARPAAAPAARPAPVRIAAAPARAAAEAMVTCDVCESEGKTAEDSAVPRSGFAKHLRETHPES